MSFDRTEGTVLPGIPLNPPLGTSNTLIGEKKEGGGLKEEDLLKKGAPAGKIPEERMNTTDTVYRGEIREMYVND